MSDLTYRLVVDMSTKGSLVPATEKLGKAGGDLTKSLGSVRDAVGGIAGGLAGAFTGAVEKATQIAATLGAAGAAAGVAGLVYGVTNLNSELEKANVSLATIFSVQGQANGMIDGMKKAGDVIKDMRKDAADLPGEFKDLLGFFRMAATPGFQAGADIKRLEKLSANAMATAAAQQLPMDQAARELAMLLQGRAGAHNVFGSLLGFSGGKAEEFNKSSSSDRLKAVEAELSKYEESRKVFGGTLDALSGTLVDNGKKFLGALTGGVFDRVKGALEAANRSFDKNEEGLMRLADRLGEKLAYAFDVGRRKVEEWHRPVMLFAANAEERLEAIWARVAPLLDALGPKVKAALSDPATFDKIESVAKLYGAVKVGGMVGPGAMKMAGGLAEGAGLSGAAAGGLGALILGLIAADIGSVGHVLTDETSSMHATATEHWTSMKASWERTVTGLGGALERLEPIGVKIADLYGTWVVSQLDRAATAIEGVASVVVLAADKFYELEKAVNHFTGLTLRDLNPDKNDPIAPPPDSAYAGIPKLINAMAKDFDESANQKKTPSVKGGGGTSIQKVEIVVSSNQDPSRIARALVDQMVNINRNPTSSRYVRNWGSSRP